MSAIDTTKPVTGTPTTASVRANFATAAAEIDAAAAAAAAAQATADDAQPALGFTAENVANKSTDVTADGASDTKYPSAKAVKTYADAHGGPIAGTPFTTTPLPYSSQTSAAHNLGVVPTFCTVHMTCITTEYGYAVGDRVYMSPDFRDSSATVNTSISCDATNIYLTRGSGYPQIQDRTSGQQAFRRTPNGDKWSMTITPYKLA